MRKKDKNQWIINCILLGMYMLVNLVLFLRHEPWRDEAQVWLLVRDLPFWKLPAQMAYEGHPCLWHLIILPFAKLGLPYLSQSVVAFVIMLSAVILLLWKSGFPAWLKAAVIFSPLCTYYYPVIARSYCLIPLLLFLLAYWYPMRNKKPVRYALMLALLVQTHAVMVVTAFMLCLCWLVENSVQFYRDRKRDKFLRVTLPLFLPFFSALFLLYQLMSVEKSSLLRIRTPGFVRMLQQILEKVLEAVHTLTGLERAACFVIFAAGVLFWLLFLLKKNVKGKTVVLSVLTVTGCFQFWFYAMVYGYSLQRLMTFFLLIIWGMWVTGLENRDRERGRAAWAPGAAFAVFCLICLAANIPAMRREMTEPYSNSRDAAAFIRDHLPADAVFITDNQPSSSSILPYLEKRTFLYAPTGEEYSFVVWDDNWNESISYDGFQEWVDNLDVGGRSVYLISSSAPWQSRIEENGRLDEYPLVYQSWYASIKEEDYKIYQIR